MFTLPNLLSLTRIFLSFAFLQDSLWIRLGAVILAAITDGLDGYLARRFGQQSRLGFILDPIADKFFVLFLLGVFIYESRISVSEAFAVMSRDIAVMIFGGYLLVQRRLAGYRFHPFWSGKLITALQFVFLAGLTLKAAFFANVYLVFSVFGAVALAELVIKDLYSERAVERK